MKVGDLVAERDAPYLVPHCEYGLIIGDLGDKKFMVMWDDGIKRKFPAWELFKVSTTWSLVDESS